MADEYFVRCMFLPRCAASDPIAAYSGTLHIASYGVDDPSQLAQLAAYDESEVVGIVGIIRGNRDLDSRLRAAE